MNNSTEIIFELISWKRLNKNFSIQVKLPCDDYFGWNDYYNVYFICNGNVKKQDKFRRFVNNEDFYNFCKFLENHELARATLNTFQFYKLDILNLKHIKNVP